jgi:hypothetical protein
MLILKENVKNDWHVHGTWNAASICHHDGAPDDTWTSAEERD